ncbi:MAG: alpha/beta hydrolase fold domain-containing protein [Phycisphaerae bacterium]
MPSLSPFMRVLLAGAILQAIAAAPAHALQASSAPATLPTSRPARIDYSGNIRPFRDVQYAKIGDKPLLLDVYVPEAAVRYKVNLPLVVWIHGGGWMSGSKADCPALPLVRRGYIAASIDYRLTQEAIFPAQIEDCKAAVRFLRANARKYFIDADHVGAWGLSAGGHLAALMGTSGGVKDLEGAAGNLDQSSRVQCIVDLCGPTDLLKLLDQKSVIDRRSLLAYESKLLGGLIEDKKELAARANPITYIGKDCPPFLIFHGDRDVVVPINQSELLNEALKAAGVDVRYEVVKGAGHDFGNNQAKMLPVIYAFFDKHLKGIPASQPAATMQTK